MAFLCKKTLKYVPKGRDYVPKCSKYVPKCSKFYFKQLFNIKTRKMRNKKKLTAKGITDAYKRMQKKKRPSLNNKIMNTVVRKLLEGIQDAKLN